MSLRQTPPGEGRQKKRTHFVYIPTQAGKTWNAWIAGPCLWFECHTKGRSKPCVHIITDGALQCPICSPLNVAEIIGYQPLYRESDARPCFTIFHEYVADRVNDLKFREPVLIGRDSGPSDGAWISRHLVKRPWYTSTLSERQEPADLTPSLLAVWKLADLNEWWAKKTKHNINAQSNKPPSDNSKPANPASPNGLTDPSEEPILPANRMAFPHAALATLFDANAEKNREIAEREARTAEWIRNQPLKGNGKHKPK